ncbi:channel protein TolC [Rhodoferax koreense]|uniref:Channel protein TolC n=1 Tax=Rhodoferax koreensis TaxID=1842727 RepID=A0A1P8JX03_9BURK|nr:TolC family outer membrane protein [Rhodoferax koreense]APW38231.1 channel protein TolC [Rhodoferax koreense]
MRSFRPVLLLAAVQWALCASAQAQSLIELYDAARATDATYQSAKAQYDANLAKSDQAKAAILPAANLDVGVTRNLFDNTNPDYQRAYTTQSATVSASQPLYRPANWASYEQGKKLIDLAQAQLAAAEQDLVLRVSQAYFDVLAASDSLTFVRAQKAAVAEQLASAKRNFEVGTSTITDSREAQARYDLVVAQEIAADNDLRVKKLALDQIVSRVDATPKPVLAPIVLPNLQPQDLNGWVTIAETSHPSVLQALTALDVARLETTKAKAGNKPTIDLTAGYNVTRNPNGTSTSTLNSRYNAANIGVQLSLPLFAGFSVQNRIRETLSLEDKAVADLEATRRVVSQATRTAFYGVLSGLGQIKALEAAEASSQSALEANQLGYRVGVRINIDVLNAQSQLYQTKRDLARARYDVLVGSLRLRQANGTLRPEDLQAVNALLAP